MSQLFGFAFRADGAEVAAFAEFDVNILHLVFKRLRKAADVRIIGVAVQLFTAVGKGDRDFVVFKVADRERVFRNFVVILGCLVAGAEEGELDAEQHCRRDEYAYQNSDLFFHIRGDASVQIPRSRCR